MIIIIIIFKFGNKIMVTLVSLQRDDNRWGHKSFSATRSLLSSAPFLLLLRHADR